MKEHLQLLNVSENIPRMKRSNPTAGRFKSRNHEQHSLELGSEITKLIENKIDSQQYDPSLIFKLDCEFNDIPIDKLRSLNCQILSNNTKDDALILFSNSVDLKEFKEKLELYSVGIKENKTAHYEVFFSNINQIIALKPEDKLGKRISIEGYIDDQFYWVNIELWHIGNTIEMQNKVNGVISHYINAYNGKMTDHCIGKSFCTIRAFINGLCINELLHEDIIQEIDLIPHTQPNTSLILNTPLSDIHISNDININSPGICILDSGIIEKHPALDGCVFDPNDYTDSKEEWFDLNGHGTMVASLCLYGDMRHKIENNNLKMEFKLFPAKILDKNAHFPEHILPETLIINSIKYYYQTHNCKIFNLSIGLIDDYYCGGKQFTLSQLIDELCAELDIIVIISSGNITINQLPFDDEFGNEKAIHDYPYYFRKDIYKLINPATSASSLTVGSYDIDDCLNHTGEQHHSSYKSIPIANGPSFYSRTGPGVSNSVKPDLVIPGGAMVYNLNYQKMICDANRAPIGCNKNFLVDSKLFQTDYGTSMAAPIITHIAANIAKQYNHLTANTIRALIINSCRYDYNFINQMNDIRNNMLEKLHELIDNENYLLEENGIDSVKKEDLIKKVKFSNLPQQIKDYANSIPESREHLSLLGFGSPSLEKAIGSSDNCVSMYGQDAILIDSFKIYEIPIPDQIKSKKGSYLLQVTLSHTPPTRHTRKDYLGYNLDLQMFKEISVSEISTILKSKPKDEQKALDSLPESKKINDNTHPCRTDLTTSTVKNYTAKFTNRKIANTDSILLVVTAKSKWIQSDVQENFSIVATFEYLGSDGEIYSHLKTAIDNRLRIKNTIIQYKTTNVLKVKQ